MKKLKKSDIEKIDQSEDINILKKKIKYLEEELVRKQKLIDSLKQENLVLFRTALKRSDEKIQHSISHQDKRKIK